VQAVIAATLLEQRLYLSVAVDGVAVLGVAVLGAAVLQPHTGCPSLGKLVGMHP
jgi:hypothetical protein